MNRLQLNQSLRDLLPTYSGEYPAQLVAYTDSLYQLSLLKIPSLPHKADVARHHLCAFLAIEKYKDRFSLPSPLLQKIPLQPRLVEKVLSDLEQKVVVGCVSPASTPTKPKNPFNSTTPNLLPSKTSYAPGTSSPLKKIQKLASDTSPNASLLSNQVNSLRDHESPFNVKRNRPTSTDKAVLTSARGTPESSPRKTAAGRNPSKTPKGSPSKADAFSAARLRYLRHITVADFISFANTFYIPASVTPQILETFTREQHKFLKRNDWLLACGLIHSAYIRINHRLLENTLGKKAELQDQLFQYQKGGLMKANMVNWLNIVEESVKNESWAIDLERKFVRNDWSIEDTSQEQEIKAKLGDGWVIFLAFGLMITPSVMFDKPSQVEYYQVWTSRVYEKMNQANEKARSELSFSNRIIKQDDTEF